MNTPPNPPNRTLVNDDPECPAFLWEPENPIELYVPVVAQIRPIEIHVLPDGSVDDEPSFCFVMETAAGVCVVAQISFEKLWPAVEAAIKSRKDLA